MNFISKMSGDERKKEFEQYINKHVKSAPRYINDLERGFSMAPVTGYSSIYDITDPDILEDVEVTKALRECSVFTRDSVGGTAGLAGLNWYIRFLKESRDSHYDFMNYFGIKPRALFEWGMEAIIFPEMDVVKEEWENLKNRIFNDERVYIRDYGRNGSGTHLYIDFYNFMLGNAHVKKDSSNNNKPLAKIRKMTGLTRNKDIYNYQVSHIWGRTKNVFLFEAPWNICYTPKIIDPFTGHETKGDLPIEFQELFMKCVQKRYKRFITDYNNIISSYDIADQLDTFCQINGITDGRFIEDASSELSPILID